MQSKYFLDKGDGDRRRLYPNEEREKIKKKIFKCKTLKSKTLMKESP